MPFSRTSRTCTSSSGSLSSPGGRAETLPRLFVGFGLPSALKEALALCRGGLEGARWVDPDDYHVTLRFVGEVDEAEADRLAEALAEVEAAPFEAVAEGFDAFGGDDPRSIHLRLTPTDGLMALRHGVEAACRLAGFGPDGRKYVPHVTLARLKGRAKDKAALWLGQRGAPSPSAFAVTSFALYTARPGGGGPYDRAVDYPLEG